MKGAIGIQKNNTEIKIEKFYLLKTAQTLIEETIDKIYK